MTTMKENEVVIRGGGTLPELFVFHYMTTIKKDEVVISGGGILPELLLMKNKEVSEMKGTEEEKEHHHLHQLVVVPSMLYLDEGIITNILIKVRSVESLYNSLRYVSKPWSSIISHHPGIHLNSLLPTKPPCLIIQHRNNSSLRYLKTKTFEEALAISTDYSYTTCLVNMDRMKEGVVQLEQEITDMTPFFKMLYIRACCNGLILATPSGIQNRETLCVINPLTNHRIVLPPRPIASGICPVPVGFVFFPSIGKYKIVTLGHMSRRDGSSQGFIQVITLSSSLADGHCGASSFSSNDNDDLCGLWRIVEAPLSLKLHPLTINGALYWYLCYRGVDLIVSFDVATEKFFMIADHQLYRPIKHERYGGFMNMGGYLAFWFFLPDEEEVQSRTFNVFVLDDIRKMGGKRGGGEWKQLHRGVTMDIDFIKTCMGRPVSCVGNGEVITFMNCAQKSLWAYHFESNHWLKLGHDLKEEDVIEFSGFHVNSEPVPFESLYSFK